MDALSDESRDATPRALVFVGFMGAGKSRAARRASKLLGRSFIDADTELERELGEPIASFFDREGEQAFRARESEVVGTLLERAGSEVIALGGGALESKRVRAALANHVVCHLEVDAEAAWKRAADGTRPLARDWPSFKRLWARRRPAYESAADASIPADARSLDEALSALELVLRSRLRLRLLWASSQSADYPVFVGEGLVASGFFYPSNGRRFVVCDESVAALMRIEGAVGEVVIQPGEQEKTLARAESILSAMARVGLRRSDVVTALGGGVVGDLAGFCAAVYQRGMRYVQVPTTLVAQVDSAYGGKTGVNLAEAKNYVGAYHQPAAVLVDPAVLGTLPERELAAGYAEVVKTALIAGGELWERVRAGAVCDEQTIVACARTKLAVVAEDERDEGPRQVLNLGHTVAHALETASGYARYRHGEAVALGLLCALRLSGQSALRAEVAQLLGRFGLARKATGVSCEEVVSLVDRDKKQRAGEVAFVLVDGPGAVSAGHRVGVAELRAAVAEVCGK